jgi:hypothetical protein
MAEPTRRAGAELPRKAYESAACNGEPMKWAYFTLGAIFGTALTVTLGMWWLAWG